MTQATEVLFPTSADEAVAQFGDGSGVTVVGGGTIVMQEISYGRIAPERAKRELLRAYEDGCSREQASTPSTSRERR